MARARPAAPNARVIKTALARRKAQSLGRVLVSRPADSRVMTQTVHSETALPSAGDAAVREAMARREAWNEPRKQLLSAVPAKVQDPPAQEPKPQWSAPDPSVPVRMARAAADEQQDDLIREALRARGTPYVWGGASRGGFDCSGFVMYLFRKYRGISLPHSASAQARRGTPVHREDLQPGDLVFFSTYRRGICHVGVYIGDNRFIHAANRRSDVRVDALQGYWARKLKGARRISPAPLKITPKDMQDYMRDASETPVGAQ
ncbi:MAG TPA: C40 family peptidase [Armatimonadota bacterium]|nr:C40 family peptidase [Armatimonadota bacterium]